MVRKENDFGSLRVKNDTIEYLKALKSAFEDSYERKMTMDDFMHRLGDCVESGEPGVYEIYCLKEMQKDQLREKIEEAKKSRGEAVEGGSF